MDLMSKKAGFLLALLVASTPAFAAGKASLAEGKLVYENNCVSCHGGGLVGAPKTGDVAAWAPRMKAGVGVLYENAIKGINTMPPKGSKLGLSDGEVKAAVDYMVSLSGGNAKAAASDAASKSALSAQEAGAPAAPGELPPAVVTPSGTTIPFNRLLKKWKPNLSPAEDGIHDPTNQGTHMLQTPDAGFEGFIRSYKAGNYVDWVQSLRQGKINPRADRLDASAEMLVMDLDIQRTPRGSMPYVIYPHKQHTEWLDCSNCHPAIFIPQKGANQISMAAILLGQKCGVCHGKVSFPISQCTKCHSKPKKDLVLPRSESASIKP